MRSPSVPWPLLLALVAWISHALAGTAAESYREPWRPQFHFTPARNWMNDPNGMVWYEGEYHLFYQFNPFGDKWGHMSWGHAVSRDLVSWQHLPVALLEENGVMIFSGSAVVDWKNTSGFGVNGQPPLVAIYTGHYTTRPLQNQHIAYSNDRGRTWTKYSGNPVLDIGEKDFRDPKVFWHSPTRRWIMTVSWPTHRQVRFYASPNLKDWSHLSDFGPAGSTSGIWECPDLFPVPIQGRPGAQRWVLVVNVGSGAPAGGSGCQYFIGHFDGSRFTLDPDFPKPTPDIVPDGLVFADFEGPNYAPWTATGNAFGPQPARGKIGDQQAVDGFRGNGLVNTFAQGDAAQGDLTSPTFEISHPYINFLIGGGNHDGKTCLNLRIDNTIVRTATGDAAERLSWKSWEVREFIGKRASLQIVDQHTGGWGHINVDHIVFSQSPARPARQPALWADFGPDFYAAVSWSDVPRSDGRRLWLGWMSNWQYANDVPTSPWRSAMSLPRELALRPTPDGLRLVQTPVRELKKLRTHAFSLRHASPEQANRWLANLPLATNGLEVEIEWDFSKSNGITGLQWITGDSEQTSLTRSPDGILTVDRSHSGRTDFHPVFARTHSVPLPTRNHRVSLHLFIDTSSLDVFANHGESVLTQLALPTGNRRTLQLLSDASQVPIRSLKVWELKSAWR